MSEARLELDALVDRVDRLQRDLDRPIVVGISGYGGAGKSTLARALVERLDDAVRMRGDDFLDPHRSHARSTEWDGVDRSRLVDDVLRPFVEARPSRFRRWDWHAGELAEPEAVPTARVMVVDLIGLFHPDALDAIDLAVWCDVPLDVAAARGMARDRDAGSDHDALWRDVWVPNDRDFEARFAPRARADVIVSTA